MKRKRSQKQIRAAILSIDIEEYSDDYSIQFNEDTTLYFTQTHIAEIQEKPDRKRYFLVLQPLEDTPLIDIEEHFRQLTLLAGG